MTDELKSFHQKHIEMYELFKYDDNSGDRGYNLEQVYKGYKKDDNGYHHYIYYCGEWKDRRQYGRGKTMLIKKEEREEGGI